MLDTIPPSTNFSLPYLFCILCENQTIISTVHDEGGGVEHIEIYYRFSNDNDTWGAWVPHQTDDEVPFMFSVPTESGFYQLSTVAMDFLGNTEQQVVKAVVRVFTPDFNGDGMVSVQDLVMMAHHFGGTASAEHRAIYDIDGNGAIDLDDTAIVLKYWS
ncbi:MAG TPA: hypothetical protein ENG06_05590 [Thermoplasmatales archaeon]|nr:hypothetical protein [Thermoplasmatales archaeon]